MIKKILFGIALVALMASCTEDYKEWAEPQSNPQGEVLAFGNGTVTPVDVIDFAEVTEERVKVCDLTDPSASNPAFTPEYSILLNGQTFALDADGTMDADELQNYVVSLYGKAPEPRQLDAQVKWVMSDSLTSAVTILSDPFEITVIPAPIAKPDLWYLVGSCIGDGSWGNAADALGTALVPMYPASDNYAILSYVGYFPAGQGFKLIHTPGNWDEQWGMGDGALVKNDGGSSDIKMEEDGYYEIVYDMEMDAVTITKYTGAVSVFNIMGMPGDYQDWNPGGTLMTRMSSVVENHDWIIKGATYATDTELKFAADAGWNNNWGSSTFPVGAGVVNGPNIPVAAGTYNVIFNDILGRYYFIAQ